MTPSGDDRPDDGADFDLEVVELEPTEPAKRRREQSTTGGARHRRVPVVIAVVVLAALAVSVIAGRSHDSNRSSSTTLPKGSDSAGLFPFRVGAQLLTGGLNGLLLVDTDTGSVTVPRIEELPPGPTTIVAHSGGTVAVSINSHLYWFTMHSRIAHSADATTAFPAARRDYLWLASARSATLVPSAPNAIATSGQAMGATSAGLVVSTAAGVSLQPTGDATPAEARLLLPAPATVIGVHADRVAWVANDCGVLRCPVHVTEIATGESSTWLQLIGRPSPVTGAGLSAAFSPDGSFLAIAMPHSGINSARAGHTAQRLIVADLRSRATTVVETSGRFELPERPSDADATGGTLDWTVDGRYLLLAPASGSGPIGVVEPGSPHVVPSRAPLGLITTAAAIGSSTGRPLDDRANGTQQPIDAGGPTPFGTPGLSILGIDDQQVDAIDIDNDRLSTWPVGGVIPKTAGPNVITAVTGGWLVVRDASVYFLRDGGGPARTTRVGAGSQVFASNHGRDAWIAVEAAGLLWNVEPYDPATGTIGPAATVGTPLGAVDDGLLVTGDVAFLGSEFDLIDRSGRMHPGPVIDSRAITVLAAAGSHVVLLGSGGLFVLDLANRTNRLITDRAVFGTALSPDGTKLGWIESDASDPMSRSVMATSVDGGRIVQIGEPGDRVLVADDGTVVFTRDEDIRAGSVDADGSSPVFGYAPAPGALLALRYDPRPPDINLGPLLLP